MRKEAIRFWWKLSFWLRQKILRKPTIIVYVIDNRVDQVISDCPGMRVVVIDYDPQKYPPEQVRYVLNSRRIAVVDESVTQMSDGDIDLIESIISDAFKRPID